MNKKLLCLLALAHYYSPSAHAAVQADSSQSALGGAFFGVSAEIGHQKIETKNAASDEREPFLTSDYALPQYRFGLSAGYNYTCPASVGFGIHGLFTFGKGDETFTVNTDLNDTVTGTFKFENKYGGKLLLKMGASPTASSFVYAVAGVALEKIKSSLGVTFNGPTTEGSQASFAEQELRYQKSVDKWEPAGVVGLGVSTAVGENMVCDLLATWQKQFSNTKAFGDENDVSLLSEPNGTSFTTVVDGIGGKEGMIRSTSFAATLTLAYQIPMCASA
jgi:opacity protein-like surface antigen